MSPAFETLLVLSKIWYLNTFQVYEHHQKWNTNWVPLVASSPLEEWSESMIPMIKMAKRTKDKGDRGRILRSISFRIWRWRLWGIDTRTCQPEKR